MPCVEKILCNLLIVPLAAVDRTMSTSRNLEYAPIITNTLQLGTVRKNQYVQYAKGLVAMETFAMDQDVGLVQAKQSLTTFFISSS